MSAFQVEFYEKENGEQPVKEFLLGLDVKMRAKITSFIVLLAENGSELREPYSKHLIDGIFELRIRLGTDITRILYFFYYEKQIILTNGFVKKRQDIPKAEIEKAKNYRESYISRKSKSL